jgi:hypothetical protein
MMTGSDIPSTQSCIQPSTSIARKATVSVQMLFGTRHAFRGPFLMSDAPRAIMVQLLCTLATFFASLGMTVALRTDCSSFAQSQHAIFTFGHWQDGSPNAILNAFLDGTLHALGKFCWICFSACEDGCNISNHF